MDVYGTWTKAYYFTNALVTTKGVNLLLFEYPGSIAFFTQEEIKEVAQEYGFTVGNFERRPIEGLVNYHAEIARSS